MRQSTPVEAGESETTTGGPLVSVLLCAYRDERTVAQSLEMFLAQTYEPIEFIMVDSSPDDHVEDIVRSRFPQVKYVHSADRMLPNEAHSMAAEMAAGDLYLFSDPGIYPPPTWIGELVDAHLRSSGPVCGSLACYENRWVEMGMHLAKFDQWLPSGSERPISIAPTAVFLCPRQDYLQAGGFATGLWLSDSLLSWELASKGRSIWFVPQASAQHHHWTGVRSFVKERYSRGMEFGSIRVNREGWGWSRTLWIVTVTLLPLRLMGLTLRSARCAWGAPRRWRYLSTLPLVAIGHGAWLAGELVQYWNLLSSRFAAKGR